MFRRVEAKLRSGGEVQHQGQEDRDRRRLAVTEQLQVDDATIIKGHLRAVCLVRAIAVVVFDDFDELS